LGWKTSPYSLLRKLEAEGLKNFTGMIEFIAVSPGKPKKQCFRFPHAAGENLTTGDNNIDIDNPGVAGESGAIRIGQSEFQSKTFIAGITGTE
jgi:hypothetical protein